MRMICEERKLVQECHRLAKKSLVTATDGNLSVRIGDNVLLTPTGRRKDMVEERDLVRIDFSGNVLEGMNATSEWPFHVAIYKARKEVQAVCHAHPVYATARMDLLKRADPSVLIDAEIRFKKIAWLPRFSPGTKELAKEVGNAAGEANIILLANHGVITFADSISVACDQMEALERYAKTLVLLSEGKV